MFTLLITFTAIALAVALAYAVTYYGGSAFQDSSARTTAVRLVNEGTQLTSAVDLYRAQQGDPPTSLAALVSGNYLKSVPTNEWTFVDPYVITTAGLTEARCLEANRMLGLTAIPSCSDPAYAQRTVCCEQ